jgi:chromosomal replication initiation ATPase DnaA
MHDRQLFEPHPDFSTTQLNTLWTNISNDLRVELGASTFDLWFGKFQLMRVSTEEVVLVAPGTMYAIWVEENFKTSLVSVFQKYLGSCGRIRFEVSEVDDEDAADEEDDAISPHARASDERMKVAPRVLTEKVSERSAGSRCACVPSRRSFS